MSAEDSVVRIILEGVNRLGPVLQSVGSEVDKINAKFAAASKSADNMDRQMGNLERSTGKAAATMRSINPTLDALDRKFKAVSVSTAELAKGMDKTVAGLTKVNAALASTVKVANSLENKLQSLDRKMTELGARDVKPKIDLDDKGAQKQIDVLLLKLAQLERKRRTVTIGIEQEILDREIASVAAKLDALGATEETIDFHLALHDEGVPLRVKALYEEAKALASKNINFDVSLDDKAVKARFIAIRAELEALGRKDISQKVRVDLEGNSLTRLGQQIQNLDQGEVTQRLVGNLRNVAVGAAIAFAGPLLSSLTAVAGALVAVGVAAGQAIAGLGGLASAAAAQTAPVLGIFAAALVRVRDVMKYVTAAQAEKDKGDQQGITVARQQESAQRTLRNAYQSLGDAVRQQKDAQEALTLARQQGIRTLNDMILAEQRSSLNAQQSNLALAAAIGSGSGGLIQSQQLDTQQAQRDANRQTVDTSRAVAGGVSGLPAVKSAQKAVEDANRAVDRAKQGIKDAQQQVGEATQKMGAAANAAAVALGKLTTAERGLATEIQRFKALFGKDGAFSPITDQIISAFTLGLRRARELLTDPGILAAARGLAGAMRSSFDDLTRFLTTGPMRQALIGFTQDAAKNIGSVTKIFESLFEIFINIARAASGPLGTGLHSVSGFLADIAKTTGSTSGQNGLRKFFEDALPPIKAFGNLLGSIGGLFLALAGPGGATQEGTRGVNELATSINHATDYVRANSDRVHEFFRNAIDATGAVLSFFVKIAGALVRTFDPNSVRLFSAFLGNVLLPVLEDVVQRLGDAAEAFLRFANTDEGSKIVRFAAYFGLATAAVNRLRNALGPLGVAIQGLGKLMLLGGAAEGAEAAGGIAGAAALGPLGWIILAAAAIIALLAIFGRLDDVVNSLKAPFKGLTNAVGDLVDVFSKRQGLGGVLDDLAGGVVKRLADTLSDYLGGALKVVTGLVKILAGLLSGNFREVLSGIGSIFSGLGEVALRAVNNITAPFRGLAGKLLNVMGLGGLAHSVGKAFSDAFDKAKGFVSGILGLKKTADDSGKSLGSKSLADVGLDASVTAALANRTTGIHEENALGRSASKSGAAKTNANALNADDVAAARIDQRDVNQMRGYWDQLVKISKNGAATITDAFAQMRAQLTRSLTKLVNDTHDLWLDFYHNGDNQLDRLASSMESNMTRIQSAAFKGFRYIANTANSALDAFGAKPVKIELNQPKPLTKATGGPIPGVGNSDTVPALLTPGEHVITKSEVQAAGGHGAIFAIRRLLGGGTQSRGGGYAAGGFVAEPGTNFSTGSEPQIVAALRKLADIIGKTIYGISGYRSPAHSVSVGGFANDPHTRGQAADIGVGSASRASASQLKDSDLRRVGLFRPFYPAQPNEINHVQLIGSLSGVAASAAAMVEVAAKISNQTVKGGGAAGTTVQKALNRVTAAANKLLGRKASTGSEADGSGLSSAGGKYGKSELEDLWIKAGGPRNVANTAAAIALAESGGNPGVVNSIGATGLWQIHPGGSQYLPPLANAKAAVAKYEAAHGFTPWTTYTGADTPNHEKTYKRYLALGGAIPGMGSGDSVPAMLTPGEHVLTKAEVAAAGGHGAIFALRRALGGGRQSTSGGYATGGTVFGTSSPSAASSVSITVAGAKRQFEALAKNVSDITQAQISAVVKALKSVRPTVSGGVRTALQKLLDDAQVTFVSVFQASELRRTDFQGSVDVAHKIVDQLKSFSTHSADGLSNFSKALDFLTADGTNIIQNLLDKVTASTQRLQSSATSFFNKVNPAAGGVLGAARKNPAVAGFNANSNLDTQQLETQFEAASDLGILEQTRQQLIQVGKENTRLINLAKSRLAAAQKKGDAKSVQRLQGEIAKLTATGDTIASSLADNAQATVQRQQQFESDLVSNVNDFYDRINAGIDRARRINTALGNDQVNVDLFTASIITAQQQIAALTPLIQRAANSGNTDLVKSIQDKIADLTTTIIEDVQQRAQATIDLGMKGIDRQNSIVEAIKSRQQAQGQTGYGVQVATGDLVINTANQQIVYLETLLANTPGLTADQINSINDKIYDLNTTVIDATRQKIQDGIDTINSDAQTQQGFADQASTIAQNLGQAGAGVSHIDQTAQIITNQIAGLNQFLQFAINAGNPALVKSLQDQITQLDLSLQDLASQRVQAMIDDVHRINTALLAPNDFQTQLAQIGAGGSIADLGRTNFGALNSALRDRSGILQGNQGRLEGLLGAARGAGDQAAIDQLTQEINDLKIQIIQNNQAIRDNTDAAFADAVSRRQDSNNFLQSVTQAGLGINNALITLNGGDPNQANATNTALLQQQGQLLKQSQQGNESDLQRLLGGSASGLSGLSGNDLVSALFNISQGVNNNQGLDDAQRTQAQGLISAILANEQSLIENTTALKATTGAITQTFTSTAFQTFRQSIFNGNGGLLPQYQIPGVSAPNTGNLLTTAGASSVSNNTTGTNIANLNVNVTNPTVTTDPALLGSKIGFVLAGSGRL